MKLGILFSGGKDSTFAAYLARQYNHELTCLISIVSENKESYMFHTPSITKTKQQAIVMNIPIITKTTKGEKELELEDLKQAIEQAKDKYNIQGIVTGAVESIYQASRVQKICNDLNLECFNPLWQKDQLDLLKELIKNKFKVILTGVFAYPLDKSYLGREINHMFIAQMEKLKEDLKLNPAGEGGEFETFVLNCPLFNRELIIKNKEIIDEQNAWRMELDVE